MMGWGTLPDTASGSSRVRQMRSTSAPSRSGLIPSSSASNACRIWARGPVSAPGPELIRVSELIRAARASSTSRATSPPREWPSRCTPGPPPGPGGPPAGPPVLAVVLAAAPSWLALSQSATRATSAASAPNW